MTPSPREDLPAIISVGITENGDASEPAQTSSSARHGQRWWLDFGRTAASPAEVRLLLRL
jgi:hypothetical protein